LKQRQIYADGRREREWMKRKLQERFGTDMPDKIDTLADEYHKEYMAFRFENPEELRYLDKVGNGFEEWIEEHAPAPAETK
jgi:hypothetical protein